MGLVYADLVISALLLPVSGYVSFQHGKAGMAGWPCIPSVFAARIIQDGYQISIKDQPLIPGAVLIITNAAVFACISLALMGIIYECNMILPSRSKQNWTQKLLLGAHNLVNTAGIALLTYGSAPSATSPDGVFSKPLNCLGALLMLFTLVGMLGWMWPTYKKAQRFSGMHPNAEPVLKMLYTLALAIPVWMIEFIYQAVYAFNHTTMSFLDPIMGTLAVRVILMFMIYMSVSIILLVGGFLSGNTVPLGEWAGSLDGERDSARETDEIQMMAK